MSLDSGFKHELYTLGTQRHKHMLWKCIWLQALLFYVLIELKSSSLGSTGPADNFHSDSLVTGQKEQHSVIPQIMIYVCNTRLHVLQFHFNLHHCLVVPFQFGTGNLVAKMTNC
jgi:hypothetical protein